MISMHNRRSKAIKVNYKVKGPSLPRKKLPARLYEFARPTPIQISNKKNGEEYLRAIYKTAPHLHQGQWSLDVGWYGQEHQNVVYSEKISKLLKCEIDQLFYYLSDHHTEYRGFTDWWKSVCSSPTHSLHKKDIVYDKNSGKIILIQDVIQRDRVWIYPQYESCVIGSGREIDVTSKRLNVDNDDTIIYITNDAQLVFYSSLQDARCDYPKIEGRNNFYVLMKCGVLKKIQIGMRPKRVTYRGIMMNGSWKYYIKPRIEANNIRYKETKSTASWSMDRDRGKVVFEYGDMFEKSDEYSTYYVEQLQFIFNKTEKHLRIRGVVVIKNKQSGIIEGSDLLEPEDSTDDENQ